MARKKSKKAEAAAPALHPEQQARIDRTGRSDRRERETRRATTQ